MRVINVSNQTCLHKKCLKSELKSRRIGEGKSEYINKPLILYTDLLHLSTLWKTQINAEEFPNVKSILI